MLELSQRRGARGGVYAAHGGADDEDAARGLWVWVWLCLDGWGLTRGARGGGGGGGRGGGPRQREGVEHRVPHAEVGREARDDEGVDLGVCGAGGGGRGVPVCERGGARVAPWERGGGSEGAPRRSCVSGEGAEVGSCAKGAAKAE